MKKLLNHNIYQGGFWKIMGVLYLLTCIISCKKFVQIPPPQTQIVTQSVFNTNATANSAQTNIYTLISSKNLSWSTSQNLGLYSDELSNYSSATSQIQLYINSPLAVSTDGSYGPWWGTGYNLIYDANAVISGLQTTVGCSPAVKQQLMGEAFFTRAFFNFYTTNIYGDVPLVLTTDYTINNVVSRAPRIQVLQQVVNDLQTAQNLLNSNYVDGSDTIVTTLRVRPNRACATALLARAYLYLGDYSQNAADYAKADSAASAVVSNSNYGLTSLSGVFLTSSKEAIWQIQTPSTAGTATSDGNFFILTNAPTAAGSSTNNSTAISPQLLSAFEQGDQRKTSWIGTYTSGSNTFYFPYKYKGNSSNYSTTNGTEYDTPIRLGEIYLIRAEARVHEGNTSGAVADLNMIRNRAGLANYAGATDQASLLTAILHERQVELFCEWGHRWFDLCRTTTGGTSNATLVLGPPGNVCQAKGGIWYSDNHLLLFPIPQSDRNNDPNLSQNPGY